MGPLTERVDVGGEYTGGSPVVVVAGSASRDLTPDDPRGWRLGGGVTYGALALARLGVAVAALVGVDPAASNAWELALLREAGVAVVLARLDHGPVFENVERPGGRRQVCHDAGLPLVAEALPGAWREAPGWLLAPVAAELPATWAEVPPAGARVALGWQGLLRQMTGGAPVRRRAPRADPLLARADLVGVSMTDLPPSAPLAAWAGWIGRDRPDPAELVMTAGQHGGVAFHVVGGRLRAARHYRPAAAGQVVDATGAGDVFLAAWLAGRLAIDRACRPPAHAACLAFAAAAASLVVEGVGLPAVPTLGQVRLRLGSHR
ncbi:MAG: PfkB family carbohydrate kinase [Candidatus Limnocylindrales bacterium]